MCVCVLYLMNVQTEEGEEKSGRKQLREQESSECREDKDTQRCHCDIVSPEVSFKTSKRPGTWKK